MKKLMNLKGAQQLNAVAQKTINGGAGACRGCSGRPQGAKCYGGPGCHCIGECDGSSPYCNLW